MTVSELLTRMSSEELTYWWAWSCLRAEEHKQQQLAARAQQNLKQWT